MHAYQPVQPLPHRNPRQRGSVLVAVLAIILLLSFIITRFMNEAVEDLEYRAIFNAPQQMRSFGYSMLEVSLATLQEVALIDEGKLYAPEQGWGDPIAYSGITVPEGWEVQVSVRDASSKLPLNTMSEALLNRLLEDQLGFDFGTARELSSSLLDWIDADDSRRLNGAESESYLDRRPAYRAANRPLQSLHELQLLQTWDENFFEKDGQPKAVYQQLEELVSVLSTGPINLNSAPAQVIELLALQDGFQDDALFDGLEQPYLKALPPSASAETGGTEVRLLELSIQIQRGSSPFVITALVEPQFQSLANRPAQTAPPSADGTFNGTQKTGTLPEQQALNYPFRIVKISEYESGDAITQSARHSTLDIQGENPSF